MKYKRHGPHSGPTCAASGVKEPKAHLKPSPKFVEDAPICGSSLTALEARLKEIDDQRLPIRHP